MTSDHDQHNPYRSPTTLEGPTGHESDDPSLSRRFRWRVVGVTVLYMYGGSLLLLATLGAIHTCIWFAVFMHRGEAVRFRWIASVTASAAVAMVLGSMIVFAGRSFWKSQWRHGLYAIASAAVLYLAFDAAGGKLIGI